MNELIKVTEKENGNKVVSARELYDFLGATERFGNWMERQLEYGFVLNVDYIGCKVFNTLANQYLSDFVLTLDTAKEISMIQRSEKGKEARQYFIACENKLKSVSIPATYAEALIEAGRLALEVEKQQLLLNEQAPKVIAFENVIDSANTYTLDSVSDILNIGRTTLAKMLEQKNWKTIKETHGTSSTRYAEEIGYAKTIYEYIQVGKNEIKTKRFVLKKKGLDKLIKENQIN